MPATTATSTAVDLSRLPAPDVVETLEFETILDAIIADFSVRIPGFTAFLESDPAMAIMQAFAFRELLLRQRVNDGAHAVMLAHATGADLDNLAALFGVTRLEITPADEQEGSPAVFEDDEALRRRVLLAPDSYSVAGPASAYIFHTLSADEDVLDAAATSPSPGEVIVSVLSRVGDGTASAELLASVEAAVNADTVRPLTDDVTVQSAAIIPFTVEAELLLYPGPDAQLILDAARAALDELFATRRRIGLGISRSAIFAALQVGGVDTVNLIQPAENVVVAATEAASADAITITQVLS